MTPIPRDAEVLSQQPKRSPLKTVVYSVLFLAVVLYVGKALAEQLQGVSWDKFSLNTFYVTLAIFSFLMARLLLVLPLRSMVASFCPPPTWRAVMVASYLPQLGKYLPGKVFSLAGIVWLLKRDGVPVTAGLTSAMLLSGLSLIVGFILSLPLLLWEPVHQALPLGWLWCSALLAGSLTCLHPRIMGTMLNAALRVLRRPTILVPPRMRVYVTPLLNYLVQWLLMGLSLYFMMLAIQIKDQPLAGFEPADIPMVIAASSLSTTLGVLAVFAPAGVGVREFILLLVLGPLVGRMEIVSIAVLGTRLIQTLVDVATGGLGFLLLHVGRTDDRQT